MVYLGIDVGGTGIQVGVVTEKGQILYKKSIVTRIDIPFEDQVKTMADCCKDTITEAGMSMADVKAIGVGVPGIANKDGIVIFCNNLNWRNVPFAETFHKFIDKPLFIDNDATVAGLAESVAGSSAGADSSVFVTLGTGVGSGIVLNGKVWNGAHGVGGEMGHMVLELDGEPCTCGVKGCLERYCSATAIIRMARELMPNHPESAIYAACGGDLSKINAKMVIDAAKENDPIGKKVFRRYINCLAQAIANIENFLDPEMIVLGGGVSKAGDYLLDALKAELPNYQHFQGMEYSKLQIATLGPDAGIIGAAMLGLDA